jgi:hypothetical protein
VAILRVGGPGRRRDLFVLLRPEEAFKALGEHTHLGLYLAVATIATVFIIALAYNQVIELFPTGAADTASPRRCSDRMPASVPAQACSSTTS